MGDQLKELYYWDEGYAKAETLDIVQWIRGHPESVPSIYSVVLDMQVNLMAKESRDGPLNPALKEAMQVAAKDNKAFAKHTTFGPPIAEEKKK